MPTTVKLVGGAPNQVPRNKDLGNLAYQDAANIAGPVAIGGALTLNQGAINGVTYLNANKVLTAGSALTFDGGAILRINNGAGAGYLAGPTGEMLVGRDSAGFYLGNGLVGDTVPMFYGSDSTPYHRWKTTTGEQMRLTSTGLGIGTSSPTTRLDVALASTSVRTKIVGENPRGIVNYIGTNGGDAFARAFYLGQNGSFSGVVNQTFTRDETFTGAWGLSMVSGGTPYETNSEFKIVYQAMDGVTYSRFHIASSGNVGIGTSSPTTKLDINTNVANSTETLLSLFNSNNSATPGVAIALSAINTNNSTATISNSYSNGHLLFSLNAKDNYGGTSRTRYQIYSDASGTDVNHRWYKSDGAETMRLNGAGNLGLGTNSPAQKLEIIGGKIGFGTNANSDKIYLYGTQYGFGIDGADLVSFANSGTGFSWKQASWNGTTLMKLDGSGNLLIGTTSSTASSGQTAKLQVAGGIRTTTGFTSSINLGSIPQNTTVTADLGFNGLWMITNGANNSALILFTRSGGSTGVQLVFSTASDTVCGTTSEPSGGTYLRIWVSGNILQIKNVNSYTGPYYMTPIATF